MSLLELSHLLQVFDFFKCITHSRTVIVSFWFCLIVCLFFLLGFLAFFCFFFMGFLFTKKKFIGLFSRNLNVLF